MYSVKNGIVYSKKGIPEAPRWFFDGRLNFEFDETGVSWVQFMNPLTREGNTTVFYRRLWDGFRYYLEKDNLNYKPQFINCKLWPFGLEAEWELQGMVFRHQIMAVDESIVIRLMVPDEIPYDCRFKLEFFEDFALTPLDTRDFRFHPQGANRKWKDWTFDASGNMLCSGYTETPQEVKAYSRNSHLDVCISADFALEHSIKPRNIKHILKSQWVEPGKTYSFIIAFPYQGDTSKVVKEKVNKINEQVENLFRRYQKAADRSPKLISPYKKLNDFISLGPVFHEFAKITSTPGAIRASNVYYNVWGWDSITCSNSTGYWGDTEHIRNLLQFMEQSADPEHGIGHTFTYDLKSIDPGVAPVQGMYISFLQLYYEFTGDKDTVKKHYPFAIKLFKLMAQTEVKDTGLCLGRSHYPDFPEYMLETNNDISTFNNSVYYCGIRSMNYLAALMCDEQMMKTTEDIIKKVEKNFVEVLFDKEKGFFVSSAEATTLQQRKVYHLSSERWENSYLDDIVWPISGRCMDFMEEHLVCKTGIRETPAWSASFDGDANQLHCWWPVNSEFFIRTANANNRRDMIDKFNGFVSYWMERLTCPEGISCYIETDEPEFDRWNALKGVWVISYVRSWYQAIMHGVFGVSVDAGGITLNPYDGEEMKLLGMNYREKRYDIEMLGSGSFIDSIESGGEIIRGTHLLPSDICGNKKRIRIKVRRTNVRVHPFHIHSGYGLELTAYNFDGKRIEADLKGLGLCRLKIGAVEKPKVAINGVEAEVLFDETCKLAVVEVNFTQGECKRLEIY